ncbi:MAG TPA: hypothetical protein VGI19_02740 [Candidatus Cybelea sp.]|jgi:hypothetical protein
MPTTPASPLGTRRLTVFAVGYVKGTPSSYAGLTVKSDSSVFAAPVHQQFNTGSPMHDLAAVMVAARFAGNQNLQDGGGLNFDQTVGNVLIDYAGSVGSTNIPTVTFGANAPTGTPCKGSLYLRTGGSGLGTSLYCYDGAVWTAVAGI